MSDQSVAADEFSDRSGLLLMSSGDPVLHIRNYAVASG